MTLADGFGREYRHALFACEPTAGALRLAIVLVDAAYTYRTATVRVGYRLLKAETQLHGRSLERARDELVGYGLLAVNSVGIGRKARTEWHLRLPETSAYTRTFGEAGNVRGNDRVNVRVNVRAYADTNPSPSPDSISGSPRAHAERERGLPDENHQPALDKRMIDAVARLREREQREQQEGPA